MAWAPDYLEVGELPEYAGEDDARITRAIRASSRAVDGRCGRQFGQVDAPEGRRYSARWNRRRGRWLVDIDDLMSTGGLAVQVGGALLTAYDLEPINAAQEGRPWERLVVKPSSAVQPTGEEYEVSMVAPWGWAAESPMLDVVKQAVSLQASRLLKRKDAPFGVAGSPQQGSELRLLAKVDPDVEVVLTQARLIRNPVVFA